MKKFLLVIFCIFTSHLVQAQMVFENKDQRWNITGIASNDDYTAIFCDITILNNKAGCFDVHELDKNTSIYISGVSFFLLFFLDRKLGFIGGLEEGGDNTEGLMSAGPPFVQGP